MGSGVSVNSGEMPVPASSLNASGKIQIWIVAVMLGVLGAWGLIAAWIEGKWQPTFLSAAMLIAAVAVVSRRWWARYLVFALSTVYVGLSLWYIGRSLLRGDFANKSGAYAFISLMPLSAFLAMACYWAYVAAVHLKYRKMD